MIRCLKLSSQELAPTQFQRSAAELRYPMAMAQTDSDRGSWILLKFWWPQALGLQLYLSRLCLPLPMAFSSVCVPASQVSVSTLASVISWVTRVGTSWQMRPHSLRSEAETGGRSLWGTQQVPKRMSQGRPCPEPPPLMPPIPPSTLLPKSQASYLRSLQ